MPADLQGPVLICPGLDSSLVLLSEKTGSVCPWEEHIADRSVEWGKMEQTYCFSFSLCLCRVEQSISSGGRVTLWKTAAAWRRRKDLGSALS